MNASVIEQFIESRKLDADLSAELRNLPKDALSRLEHFIETLQPSANTVRDIYQLTREICLRDRIDLFSLFSDPEWTEILEKKGSRKERQKLLRQWLEIRRFPQKAKLERELASLQEQIRREFGIRLEYPEDFEGGKCPLMLSVTSVDSMAQASEKLKLCAESSASKRFFDLLHGTIDKQD